MKWSGSCWFLPAASERIFHEVKTKGLLLWSVCCHTAGFWLLNRRKNLLVLCRCTSFIPIFSFVKASIVSLDITMWHQYVLETQLGNPSCSREISASVFSTNFVRMTQPCEIITEITCDFSRRCTPHEMSWFVLQLEFPPPNLTQWRVAV